MEQQSKQNVRLFMNDLDEKSRRIFWRFRWYGHAKLYELVDLIGATSDMEVLSLINEVINPTAMIFFNRPALEFSESRIDCITGKKVFFNWWLLDFTGDNELPTRDENLVDIFDEEDKIVIVCEVSPSIRVSENAKVEQRHGILSISIDKL